MVYDASKEFDAARSQGENRDPWTWSNFAVPLHYFASGAVQNSTYSLLYGVLMGVMAVRGYVYVTARALVMAPWILRCVFGMLSDCVPVAGYRRKSYCVLGWLLVLLAMLGMRFMFTEPDTNRYCSDATHGGLGDYRVEMGVCNPDAGRDAWLFVILVALSMLGLTIADSASDGLIMECAQSWECAFKKGRVLSTSMVLRMLGGASGSLFTAGCFNGRRHLGFFDWELSLDSISVIVGCIASGCMVAWVLFSPVENQMLHQPGLCSGCKPATHERLMAMSSSVWGNIRHHIGRIAQHLCTSPYRRFVWFQILATTMTWAVPPSHDMIKVHWVHVQQMQEQVTDVVTLTVFSLSLSFFRTQLLEASKQNVVMLAAMIGSVGNLCIMLFTICDATRSQYFYLSQDIFLQLPRAVNYFVCTLVCSTLLPTVEIAGFAYGVIGSLHSLAPVFARALFNPVYAYLPVIARHSVGALSIDKYYLHETYDYRLVLIGASVLFAALCMAVAPLSLLLPSTHVALVENQDWHYARNRVRCVCTTICILLLVGIVLASTALVILPAETTP